MTETEQLIIRALHCILHYICYEESSEDLNDILDRLEDILGK